MLYHIKNIEGKEQIEQCERFSINQYMWNSKKEPNVYGFMGYIDGEGFFVKMVCEEKNPKRVCQNHRDPVCTDSAMEIFLAFPAEGEALTNDCMYTNFEINANGAMLAKYGKGRKGRESLTDEQFEMTGVKAVIEEDRWYVEVLFPEAYLNQICDFQRIIEGRAFYCNFYKIAEDEEILHFGSYSPIESATPNFHLPICFAEAVVDGRC